MQAGHGLWGRRFLKGRRLKAVFAALCLFMTAERGFSQEVNLYSVIVNYVSANFWLPLIGVVNIADGDHNILEFGAFNWNTGNFSGFQFGLLFNNVRGFLTGYQLGLVNATKDGYALQTGLLNIGTGGFFALQMGVFNIAVQLDGIQIGLINYIDNGDKGLLIGIINIARKNGYYALEANVSELTMINLVYKMGLPWLYTSFIASYLDSKAIWCFGLGYGTIIDINRFLYFNCEINALSMPMNNDYLSVFIFSLEPAIAYKIDQNISLLFGPSVKLLMNFGNAPVILDTYFPTVSFNFLSERNTMFLGAKFALRYRF